MIKLINNSMFKAERSIILGCLLFLIITLASCGEDFKNSGIEGQWQLREIEYSDGHKEKVDTIFYSFKKSVFRYLKLKSDTESFYCYGNYDINGDELSIDLDRDSFEPRDDENSLDWDSLSRKFTIKEQNSTSLILLFDNNIYYFRKY